MKLTNKSPKDWKDLQDQVARLFNEAGYIAETPKTIQLVRGKKEVDVFVTAKHEILNTLICECKYWNTPIPEEIVHSFRTVVYDSGSMLGIVISKVGFQKGAIEAAQLSNVILKTWDEFQQMLLIPWTLNGVKNISKLIQPLSVYTDPLDCDEQLKHLNYEEYKVINDKFQSRYFKGRILLNRIVDENLYERDYIDYDNQRFVAIEDFFDYYINVVNEALTSYKDFFSSWPIDSWKLGYDGPTTFC